MENANGSKNDTVDLIYQGSIYIISKEEYEALKEGLLSEKDMFE